MACRKEGTTGLSVRIQSSKPSRQGSGERFKSAAAATRTRMTSQREGTADAKTERAIKCALENRVGGFKDKATGKVN